MLPVTVSQGVFKTLNDRQFELNKKCEAIKQIFNGSQVKLLESSWFTLGSETFVELKPLDRQGHPTTESLQKMSEVSKMDISMF